MGMTEGPLPVAALRTVVRQPGGAWAAWALMAAAGLALDLAARAAGVDLEGARPKARYWTFQGIEGLLTSAASGWALALILTGAPPRAGRYVVFVLLLAAMELYWDGATVVSRLGSGPDQTTSNLQFLALGLFMALGVFVFGRLMLWPIGRLTGSGGPSPAGSWARMEGQVWAYFGTGVLLTFPVMLADDLVSALGFGGAGGEPSTAMLVLDRLESVIETGLLTALGAVMWRRRQGVTSERLSDVFA